MAGQTSSFASMLRRTLDGALSGTQKPRAPCYMSLCCGTSLSSPVNAQPAGPSFFIDRRVCARPARCVKEWCDIMQGLELAELRIILDLRRMGNCGLGSWADDEGELTQERPGILQESVTSGVALPSQGSWKLWSQWMWMRYRRWSFVGGPWQFFLFVTLEVERCLVGGVLVNKSIDSKAATGIDTSISVSLPLKAPGFQHSPKQQQPARGSTIKAAA